MFQDSPQLLLYCSILQRIHTNSTNSLSPPIQAKQYKEKCDDLNTSVSRLQLTRDRLESELLTTREDLTKTRHSLESQRKTMELLRVTEIKQRTQNEALMRESRNQTTLLANLQTIHNNLERQEFEQKNRVEKRVGVLESELAEARRMLQNTELKYMTAESIQGNKTKELEVGHFSLFLVPISLFNYVPSTPTD